MRIWSSARVPGGSAAGVVLPMDGSAGRLANSYTADRRDNRGAAKPSLRRHADFFQALDVSIVPGATSKDRPDERPAGPHHQRDQARTRFPASIPWTDIRWEYEFALIGDCLGRGRHRWRIR